MTTERTSSRLPLRAGAMVLLSIAVVFIGLGWHSAVTTTRSPEADLAAAAKSSSATASSTPVPAGAGANQPVTTAEASPTTTTTSGTKPLVCVFNAGSVKGLATEVNSTLKAKGWRVAPPGNLTSSSITENTVFYTPTQKAAATELAADLGEASLDARPASFTRCPTGIAVVVVTR
ncbi:LytR C-terminal domain-containing protein [Williamsia sp. CHRR-6]|uniref:LytR C-terminal domain-containing protein n=1 Tax=Williamsia sp. CHRR-6 TaxID=2835871 RepID=UPI001BDA0D78|nr:LytR C-terminal domain-containing protein [Williamsia sp. CHRR-6]MBT0567029.1 LytR C-terminal domain-containing protein [Williamsia sp. CHRR-6]